MNLGFELAIGKFVRFYTTPSSTPTLKSSRSLNKDGAPVVPTFVNVGKLPAGLLLERPIYTRKFNGINLSVKGSSLPFDFEICGKSRAPEPETRDQRMSND